MQLHGVGTITFYDPKTGDFGALGHGILDVDTEELIDIARGDIITSKIVSIVKAEKGKPGELQGSIDNGKVIGEVCKNTNFGIYGKLDNVEELNLEAACALGILEECVPRRVYMSGLTCHENYHYIPQKNYWQHIADHPEWEELLRFNMEEGKMTADELREAVDEKGFQDVYSLEKYYISIYTELYFAFLQKNYTVQFKRNEYIYGSIYRTLFTIGKKEQTDDKKEDEIFPPRFCFKISRDAPQYDELKNCIEIGESCNKEHRLIQFLIKNGRVLREQVPGLWNKMLRVLLEERGNTLVSEVNLILSDLRKITDLGIHVPDSLFLSDKDAERVILILPM